jgi:hypothetical protein
MLSTPNDAEQRPPSTTARRRAERRVTELLLVETPTAVSAGAVVRAVLACSRELVASGVDHGSDEALLAMGRARLTSDLRVSA